MVVASLLTACGSTVQQTSTGASGLEDVRGGAQGSVDEAGEPLTSPNSPSGVGGPTLPGGSRPTGSGPASAGGRTPPTDQSPRGSAPSSAPTGPIRIGVQYSEGSDDFYKALGLGNLSIGDGRAQAQAVINDINRTGGIAGRKVEAVFVAQNSTDDKAVQDQAACESWTTDKRVFAVVSPLQPSTKTLIPCLARRGVPVVGGGVLPYDDKDYRDFPDHFYGPYGLGMSRMLAPLVQRLQAQGYFSADAKIGVLRYDQPVFSRAFTTLKSELAKVGKSVEDEASVSYPSSTADLGQTSSQISSAVLRFRSRGVTHVLFLEGGGGMPLTFMQAADSQSYRPRYGLYSYSAPDTLKGLVPASQLTGAVGIGWIPTLDVDAAHDPTISPARQRCRTVMKAARQDQTSRLTEAISSYYCDSLYLLQTALEGASPTVAELRRRVDALGTSFAVAGTFTARLTATQHDGASSVRDLAFRTDCSCFAYTGPAVDVR